MAYAVYTGSIRSLPKEVFVNRMAARPTDKTYKTYLESARTWSLRWAGGSMGTGLDRASPANGVHTRCSRLRVLRGRL